jgi:spore maturation protein CgeB
MQIAYFTHSLVSCWNHGNAHFQRGVLRELARAGHRLRILEPADGWSRLNLERERPEAAGRFASDFPELSSIRYRREDDPAALVDGAELVIVHEWTDPALVAAIGRLRARDGRFLLLFHDTHHRAVSDPQAIRAFDLSAYDGVLAFGEALAEVYRRWGWGDRVMVWHEAADTRLFRPIAPESPRRGLVWIGNWGDGERTEELERFLLRPSRALGLPLDVYGVRYPLAAQESLARFGARYRGWLANAAAPGIFARHLATVHVPRRFYAEALPGIPTIRVFEALACGIPLVSAPWRDSEGLFRPGEDFLVARDEAEMRGHLAALAEDAALRAEIAAKGLAAIRARHTCRHRARELLAIVERLRPALCQPALQRGAA